MTTMATLSKNSADRFAPDRLTGRQKVAILCMAIGAEAAAKLTSALHAEEAEIVALTEAENQLIEGKLSEPLNGLLEVLGTEDAVRRAVLAWIALKHSGSPLRKLDSPTPAKGESA